MNVLLIGGGGREHAIAWALNKSERLTTLFCAPGNAGIAKIANCVTLDVTQHDAVISFCAANSVRLVVIGPEAPLVAGLADDLASAGVPVFGPSRLAAQLEGSKAFTKALCEEASIPTAAYGQFSNRADALAYLDAKSMPIVIKADGLAAGKGVVIAETLDDARTAVEDCFSGAFGKAGESVVIEEFLRGEEASFFALVDGETVVPFGTAQDHKRVGDGDTGPNTGGMGAYSPAPIMTSEMCVTVMREIIVPTARTMVRRGQPYRGILYAGLMLTEEGPKLIEYNVRFGDPEAQVLMTRLESDLLDVMLSVAEGRLSDCVVSFSDDVALTVVMAANGYPGVPETGSEIRGLDTASRLTDVEVFHAGTTRRDGHIVATGGRVLNVTARGRSVIEAQSKAYAAVERIDWPGGFYRRDIGWRALAREGN